MKLTTQSVCGPKPYRSALTLIVAILLFLQEFCTTTADNFLVSWIQATTILQTSDMI